MTRAALAIVTAFAAIFATAETNRTATENWTRNRIGEATNATLQAAKDYADAHGGDVQSVNGKTGTVVLAAADVHALPDTYTPPAETDPTVPDWAKADTPPEGMTANAAVLTNGALKTKSGTAITAANVGAASKADIDKATNAVPRIVMGDLEVRADLTAKVVPEHAGEWVPSQTIPSEHPIVDDKMYISVVYEEQLGEWITNRGRWDGESWVDDGLVLMLGDYTNPEATELTFPDGTPTRRVPSTRETKLATTNDLTTAISTNNPAFVSAVRDTPPGTGTPWGEYGTVGAALAGLVALVALMAKRTAFAAEYNESQAYAVGDIVWHDGKIYQCKTAIATGGEAWTDAHWNGPMKLSDFFQNSNSLLVGTIDGQTKASASEITGDTIALPDGGVVSASSSAPAITFGTARQTNGLRFCELYITNPDTTTDGAIVSISGKVYSDVSLTDLPKLEKGATYYFTFAEFKVTQETVEGETVNVSHWKVSKQKLDATNGEIPTPTAA